MDYLKEQLDAIDQKIAEARKLLDDPEMKNLARIEIDELERRIEALENKPVKSDLIIGMPPDEIIEERPWKKHKDDTGFEEVCDKSDLMYIATLGLLKNKSWKNSRSDE